MSMIADLKERRRTDKAALESLNKRISTAPASEARTMTKKFGENVAALEALDDRIAELDEQEVRESAAAKHRVQMSGGSGGQFFTSGPEIYSDPTKAGVDSPSFFRDMYSDRKGDYDAAERLSRNQAARTSESRALNTDR